MINIHLLPVYSQLAQTSDIPLEIQAKLPASWQLSKHQIDTYKALVGGEHDVIFNTAMTGDGKSLAAYLPVLVEARYHAFGMYPTNELLRDQARQFQNYIRQFDLLPQNMPYDELWGAKLVRFQEENDFRSRGEALKERFTNHHVILTNPDIFNLVMNFTYGQKSLIFNSQELPYSLSTNFDYFVFDEYHIFGISQVIAATTAMLYIAHQSNLAHRFLFSTATPNPILGEMIERSGLKYQTIQGQYRYELEEGYRQVLYPADLSIYNLPSDSNAEQWVQEHIGDLVAFWKANENRAKGAIILNSVITARRVAQFLSEMLRPHGITVGENTGLTDEARRKQAIQCDLVVGTSTIDVGVDFNINYLVFESTNAGTFLQRLGRLGRVRHNLPGFAKYQAHALLSGRAPWIYERLVEKLSPTGCDNGRPVERPTLLRQAVEEAFPPENDFFAYGRRWGILQSAHVLNVLQHPHHQGAYVKLAQTLNERYGRMFGLPNLDKAQKRYYAVSKFEERGLKILDEVLGFRGAAPFQVVCLDATVQPAAFLSYDLFSLVQSADYSVMTKDEYLAHVQHNPGEFAEQEARTQLKYTLGGDGDSPLILRIEAFYGEREKLVLKLGEDASRLAERVVVLNNFAIDEPRTSPYLGDINRILKRQSMVCLITRSTIEQIRRQLRLPAFFPVYRLRDMHRNREYSVAFGKNALLLDAVLLRYRQRNLDDEPIIL